MADLVTRFAPSPTGFLHLGHLHSALQARRLADANGGEMRLRIEDIDAPRCRPEFHGAILDDLAFMGIGWEGDVMVQSERMDAYAGALELLKRKDLVYPCFLSRKELDALLSAPHDPSGAGSGGAGSGGAGSGEAGSGRVSNTDRLIGADDAAERRGKGQEPAWRLRMEAAAPLLKGLDWADRDRGRQPVDFAGLGDEVVARKDIATSYHLAVVVDDAAQGVTHVVRGSDLEESTPLHRVLQALLGLPETTWSHHSLVLDGSGRRLSKRGDSLSVRAMRHAGMDASAILEKLDSAPKA